MGVADSTGLVNLYKRKEVNKARAKPPEVVAYKMAETRTSKALGDPLV
jgi:hypothetical protein